MLTKDGLPLSQPPSSAPLCPKASSTVDITLEPGRSPERLGLRRFYSSATEGLLKLRTILSFHALSATVSTCRDYSGKKSFLSLRVNDSTGGAGPLTATGTQTPARRSKLLTLAYRSYRTVACSEPT